MNWNDDYCGDLVDSNKVVSAGSFQREIEKQKRIEDSRFARLEDVLSPIRDRISQNERAVQKVEKDLI